MDKYTLNVSSDTTQPSEEHIEFDTPQETTEAGHSEFITLRPGFSIAINPIGTPGYESVTFEMENSPIQFGFLLTGNTRCSFHCGSLNGATHEMKPGSNGISYLPKTKGTLEQPTGQTILTMTVMLSPARLFDFMKDDMDSLPQGIQRLAEGKSPDQFVWYGTDHPSKRMLLQRIMECPYTGTIRKLYYEGLALELISTQLHECSMESKPGKTSSFQIAPSDIERIKMARDILVSDLENPPTLLQLAQNVGVNDNKLKRGFRTVFNKSVFEYYRDYRMDKAREYLAAGDMSVSEAAYRIGYLSLGHFSQAFAKRFGVAPREFLNESKSKSMAQRIAQIN